MIAKFPSYVFIDDSTIEETRVSNVLSSEFETGPLQYRPQSCSTRYQLSFVARIHIDDYRKFLDWFEIVLRQGSSWFLMKDHAACTEHKYKYRFLNEDLQFRKRGDIYEVTLSMERFGDARL
jgi:hypothetical protein